MIPSRFRELGRCPLPDFDGIRILQMPIILGDDGSIPDYICDWIPALLKCAEVVSEHVGKVCYLTIDEKTVVAGESSRRPNLHVDGYWKTGDSSCGGSWGGGGGGGMWGGGGSDVWHQGTGLLTISNPAGCKVWNQDFEGEPHIEGDCEFLREKCGEGELLASGTLYWLSSGCVHESLPMRESTKRQFMRLSLPSTADWYEGCTPNPLGVLPTGRIMPQRKFMKGTK